MEDITFNERELKNDRRFSRLKKKVQHQGKIQKIMLSINFWIGTISVTVIVLMAASFFWTVDEFRVLRTEMNVRFDEQREYVDTRFNGLGSDIKLIKEKLGI